MNPSSSGWILKFINHFEKEALTSHFKDEDFFYQQLKSTGFIYGVSINTLMDEPVSELKLTLEEYTKINLFHALLFTFYNEKPNAKFDTAINKIIRFYKNIEKGKKGFFQKLSLTHTPSGNLEQILSARLSESNSLLKSSSASILTYALLYVDVLAFRSYLNSAKELKKYIGVLEDTIINCTFLALESKEKKNKYDNLLLELFNSSSSYLNDGIASENIFTLKGLRYLTEKDRLEKRYLLDLCCLAVKDDHVIDDSEQLFLEKLTAALQLQPEVLEESIHELEGFSATHATRIKLFEYAHPINQFYKQSTQTVKQLILRNKNRLLKELDESGELLLLLTQSTLRDLSKEEKSKMKDQLLDVCKSVPSLAIFLLPGGTLLLPLLVKFIPQLLPSAFDENRIKEEKK